MNTVSVKDQLESDIVRGPGSDPTESWERPNTVRPDTILSGTAALLLFSGLQRAIGFGRSLILCRLLTTEALGQWNMAFGFLTFAMPLTVMGIPGSLGRYIEFFRKRGLLSRFLRGTFLATIGLGLSATTVIVIYRQSFSRLIFGQPGHETLVVWVAITLFAMVLFGYVTRVFVSMRIQRISSFLQFLNGVLFAVGCILLVVTWQASSTSVVVAQLLALVGCCGVGGYFMWRTWQGFAMHDAADCPGPIWSKLAPFSLSLWVLNGLWGLLTVVDRYMLVHFSELDSALEIVGQYHVARIVPLLLTSVTGMFAVLLLPYLSRDWEMGQNTYVGERVDLFVRVVGLATFGVAVFCLVTVPVLFRWGFGNKFELGLAILGMTLAYAVALSTFSVARIYLLCDEKVSLVNVAVAIAIAVNVVMNLLLLRRFGLHGAASAACASAFVLLFLVLSLARLRGMPLSPVTMCIAFLPLSLLIGGMVPAILLVLVLVLTVVSPVPFSSVEKNEMKQTLMRLLRSAEA